MRAESVEERPFQGRVRHVESAGFSPCGRCSSSDRVFPQPLPAVSRRAATDQL